MKSQNDPKHKAALESYASAMQAARENRELMIDDQKFLAGDQWPDDVKAARKGRPIQTINRLPAFVDQIVGDARQNKPSIKVHPAEDGDEDVAEIYAGLIRNIEVESNADYAYDTAIEHSSSFGFGAWRITTDYCDAMTFDQDIKIERIVNPMSVLFGPAFQPDYSDAPYVFVIESITRDEYKRRWPKADLTTFDSGKSDPNWQNGEMVQVAEYWYKHHEPATLYLLQDGTTTTDAPPEKAMIVSSRPTEIVSIRMCVLSGAEILEEKTDYPGKYLPIIGAQGKEDMVDGKRILRGIVRFAKDPQRMYNYWRTIDTEQKALAPRAPVLVTAEQIDGHEEHWKRALTGNLPFLTYNNEQGAPMPQRLNAGLPDNQAERAAMLAVDELKSTTGIFSASLGEQGNETSGRAILARQREGDTATYAYIDNLGRAIRHSARVIIDLIPHIYNTERVIQVMGVDGQKTLERINATMEDGSKVNDLTTGKYDLVVTVGPSYATKRIEALNNMVEIAKMNPAIMQVAGDLMVKAMDWEGAEEIADRLKLMLPPQILQAEQEGEGQQIAPELPAQIDQGMQLIEQQKAEIEKLQDELEDKDEDRRLRQYEIDVKAAIEAAKIAAANPDSSAIAQQAAQILAQQWMEMAASAPDVTEEPEGMEMERELPDMEGGMPMGMPEELPPEMMEQIPPELIEEIPNIPEITGDMPEEPM
ncbi:MAG: hypothetical protein IPH54_16895 [Rhodoferax sp.]|nr:hypothetical protein [Rhodoferax sp.]